MSGALPPGLSADSVSAKGPSEAHTGKINRRRREKRRPVDKPQNQDAEPSLSELTLQLESRYIRDSSYSV